MTEIPSDLNRSILNQVELFSKKRGCKVYTKEIEARSSA